MEKRRRNRVHHQRQDRLQAHRSDVEIGAQLRQFRPAPEETIQLLQGLTDCLALWRRLQLAIIAGKGLNLMPHLPIDTTRCGQRPNRQIRVRLKLRAWHFALEQSRRRSGSPRCSPDE